MNISISQSSLYNLLLTFLIQQQYLDEFLPGEDVWSDLTATPGATGTDAYVFGNGKSQSDLDIQHWSDNAAVGDGCVKMIGSEEGKLTALPCTESLHYVCMKQSCPQGT